MRAPDLRNILPTLSREEMKSRALAFAKAWTGPQREKSEAQTFLNEFFAVFGRDRRSVDARFEHHVERNNRGEGSIDLFWPGKFLVEMKSTGRDLSEEKGGAARQAFDYIDEIPADERPRWVMVSDFARFIVYDLGEEIHEYLIGFGTARKSKPVVAAVFGLRELPDKLRHFAFIRDEEQALFQVEPDVNLKAVALLGALHDELKNSGYAGHRLERFLVRVLFCLFAEDTDIFEWNLFTRFVERSKKDGSDLGQRLGKLFEVLHQDQEQRSEHLSAEFAAFPYVNGGLFEENLTSADMTTEHRAALLACCRFDWSLISPGVFGSLFQGVMDKKERREKGAHYTSEENIRRVIDPLFLDELKAEFRRIQNASLVSAPRPLKLPSLNRPSRFVERPRTPLEVFHEQLATLCFLDPACGCGNFLVVAYRELRALELDVLRAIHGDQLPLGLGVEDIARVNVDQFFGIELEEFPALIAETALWLTDHQVNMAFSKAFGRHFARIPLKKSATIVTQTVSNRDAGNALRLDWTKVLPRERCSYVLGNPPFKGSKLLTEEQAADMAMVAGDIPSFGVLDYVAGWYIKTADYVQGTAIRCAFFSTNSISQGEQVAPLWSHLFRKNIRIHFAHRTFIWRNEAKGNAHVHVVIIGFAAVPPRTRILYEYDKSGNQTVANVTNINPYLIVGNDTLITARSSPLCAVPPIANGSIPADGGHLILEPKDKEDLVKAEPEAEKWIRRYLGAVGFTQDEVRYCLWLENCPPDELRRMPQVMARVAAVREMRLKSDKAATRKKADFPSVFTENRQPRTGFYLAIPRTSSEARRYIPIGFLSAEVIAANDLQIVPDADPYVFGVVSSLMHLAWMSITSGRLKSDPRYSVKLTYNTFPWPDPTAAQRAVIEAAGQSVLDARAPRLASGSSLADLYDTLVMPADLLRAHQALDRAVEQAYRAEPFATDRERVEFLFSRYERITSPLTQKSARNPRRKTSQRPPDPATAST